MTSADLYAAIEQLERGLSREWLDPATKASLETLTRIRKERELHVPYSAVRAGVLDADGRVYVRLIGL